MTLRGGGGVAMDEGVYEPMVTHMKGTVEKSMKDENREEIWKHKDNSV